MKFLILCVVSGMLLPFMGGCIEVDHRHEGLERRPVVVEERRPVIVEERPIYRDHDHDDRR